MIDGLFAGDVFRTLVACRAQRPKVHQLLFSAEALVLDVADMETDRSSGGRVDVAWGKAAHLAGETIAVKNLRPKFRGNWSAELERGFFRRRFFQEILAWLEIGVVVVREDRPVFVLAQLTNPPRPFAHANTGSIPHLN